MRVLYVLPLILVLFIPTLSHGLDVGDDVPYIGYMSPDYAINKQPTICVLKPNDPLIDNFYNTTEISIKSVRNWVGGLKQISGGNWDTTIVVTSSTNNKPIGFDVCDIRMQFKMYDLKSPTTAGETNTRYVFGMKPTADIIIYTYKLTKINNTNWEAHQRSEMVVQNIIEHELGHAFNLDHYYNVDNGDKDDYYNVGLARNSIMYPSVPPFNDVFFHIQPSDYDAVIQRFGADGWAGAINTTHDKHYIIP